MEIEPKELIETARQAAPELGSKDARLNATVAVTVALLATFMGICKVKDDNLVQAMQQAQADRIDHWSYYQARNVRQEIAEAALTQLELARLAQPIAQVERYDAAIAKYRGLAADQIKKKEDLRLQAITAQKTYDALNYRDDQFDLADALIAIAISMLAVTALTQLWALYFTALVPTVFGVLMGLAGLLGWSFHPDALVKLLS